MPPWGQEVAEGRQAQVVGVAGPERGYDELSALGSISLLFGPPQDF